MRLDYSYYAPRESILMISPLPSISNDYALLGPEEKHIEVHK